MRSPRPHLRSLLCLARGSAWCPLCSQQMAPLSFLNRHAHCQLHAVPPSQHLLLPQALAASVAQERQASYMYIIPLEHTAGRDAPEVPPRSSLGLPCPLPCRCTSSPCCLPSLLQTALLLPAQQLRVQGCALRPLSIALAATAEWPPGAVSCLVPSSAARGVADIQG